MSAGSRKGALIFGLILMGIGLVFFLANWYSTLTFWQLIARYWPLLLVMIGAKKLYVYATWQQDDEPPDPAGRRSRRRRPSLMAGLLWVALGIVFLLNTHGIGPDLGAMARRYWPILLILLGLGKIIDYFRQKEGVSLKVGEVFGVLFVAVIGLAIVQIPKTAFRDLATWPINIGGTDVFLGTSHDYTQDYTYPLSAKMPVRVENSNGQVTVAAGSDGEIRIHLRKRVFEDDETRARQIADDIKVEGGEEGKANAMVFVVKTNREDLSPRNYHFITDMDVFVPKQVQLELRNPFGGVSVSGLDCDLNVQSSQKPLEVRDCSGTFKISNLYAESKLTNLTGNVSVDTRGAVEVTGVKGDVDVRDEYAPVRIEQIEGAVTVSDEGDGITIDNVSKPVVVNARGSRVTVTNLKDNLKIASSHQRVQVSDVAANVILSSSYASSVTLRRIKGNVDITSNSDRITLEEVSGYIKASAQGTSVRANTVGGPVEINTTLRDVTVNDFSDGCKVTNEYGDVSLSTETLGKAEINVKNHNGDITVFLPLGAAFQLDATTRNGRIQTDFSGLEPVTGDSDITTMRGRLKAGGPKIILETENKDIHVRARSVERPRQGGN